MSNDFNKLTQGAIGHILQNTPIEQPVFQMLAYKNMPSDSGKRYRLVVSDGAYSYQCCIIMGDLAAKVENGEIDRFCLLKIARYMLNEIQGKQVIVLADPKLIKKGSEIGEKLGDPIPFGNPDAPPLSNFRPNYHLDAQENSMDVEFDNDPFAEIDTAPMNKKPAHNANNSSNQMRSERFGGQASRQAASSYGDNSSHANSTLNPKLACPINSLTPYSSKWLIKGRCTSKTNKRSWSNAKGEGTLFAFDIKDETGDIRLTAFKAECERLFDYIKVDEVYLVSKGQIKTANKQYSRTSSDYEITLNQESVVELCNDETGCPQFTYDFKPFNQLETNFEGYIDVIGIIKHVANFELVTVKKTNKEVKKRNLIILDETKTEVELVIWGDDALNFAGSPEDVIAVRGVRVSDFSGISLVTSSNSVIQLNPPLDKAHELKGWYSRVKNNLDTKSLTVERTGAFKADWKNLNEITPENVQRESSITLQTKATIYQIGKPTMYKACDCNKKLIDLHNDTYRCEKCSKDTDTFNWRIFLSLGIADHTKNIWAQAFHEDSMKLIGDRATIEQIGALYESNPSELEEMLRSINFSSYIFKLKARMEHFNDNSRVRTQINGIAAIDYASYGNLMLKQINEDKL